MPHVLVIEDTPLLAEMYQTSIQSRGIDCSVAGDGEKGLALVQELKPDLVLLDLMIPKLSGDEVLQRIRNDDDPTVKDTRVILLTNISETEAPDILKTLKFERYIVKANETLTGITQIVCDMVLPAAV